MADVASIYSNLRSELKTSKIKSYPHAFTGASLIEYLKKSGAAESNAQTLLEGKLIVNCASASNVKFSTSAVYTFAAKRKIVIVGGGYGGAALAKQYDATNQYDLVLIDEKPYFENFIAIPFFWQKPEDAVAYGMKDHNKYLKNATIIASKAKSITAKEVECENGTIVKDFDILIIGTGCRYNDSAIQVTVNQGVKNSRIIRGKTVQDLISYKDDVAKAYSIAIIGGGVTGLEIVHELVAKYPNKKYTVINSADRLVPGRDEKVHKHQLKRCVDKKIEVLLSERVTSIVIDEVQLQSGKKLQADVVFYTFGLTPNSECIAAGAQKDPANAISLSPKNFVSVNKFLQSEKHPHVFTFGDVADTGVERRVMAIADQLPIIQNNVPLVINKETKGLKEYKPSTTKPPLLISNGPSYGVIATPNDGSLFGSVIVAWMKGGMYSFKLKSYV